jgi:hypothetical protein
MNVKGKKGKFVPFLIKQHAFTTWEVEELEVRSFLNSALDRIVLSVPHTLFSRWNWWLGGGPRSVLEVQHEKLKYILRKLLKCGVEEGSSTFKYISGDTA